MVQGSDNPAAASGRIPNTTLSYSSCDPKESFAVDNSAENYVDEYTFCSVESSKFLSEENFSMSSGNKS